MANFSVPNGSPLNLKVFDSNGNQLRIEMKISREWQNFVNKITASVVGNTQSGPTANRPTSQLNIGQTYYDTDLGFQIAINQVNPIVIWHDGSGNPV